MTHKYSLKLVITCLAFTSILSGCGLLLHSIVDGTNYVNNSNIFRQGQHGELSKDELEEAKIAWKYFDNNYNLSTGMISSIDHGTTTGMWDIADYIAALVSAQQLEIINNIQFDERLTKILTFLNTMQLFDNKIPNKYYSVMNGDKVDLNGTKSDYGWSAVEIGRLLIWLKILSIKYPNYSEYIDKAILRWSFCDIIDISGGLISATKTKDSLKKFEEGRLGIEEYVAKGFKLWGFSPNKAMLKEPYETININNISILFDKRNLQNSNVSNAVTSLPYILQGLEFNWDLLDDQSSMDSVHSDTEIFQMSEKIYKIQEERYSREKIFTARDSHRVASKQSIVFDSIFAEGYPWNVILENGDYEPNLSIISIKAVFGMWSLWKTDYTKKLYDLTNDLYDSQRGWFEGRYEQNSSFERQITLTTNSMVLESLFYKKFGRIYFDKTKTLTYYDTIMADEFKRPTKRCFPPDKREDVN